MQKVVRTQSQTEELTESKYDRDIVVVEDDPSLFKFWKRLSKTIPCKSFTIINSPEEAVEWITKNPADVLLTDLSMPGMTGSELIKRASKIKPDLKTILTSGFIGETAQYHGLCQFLHIVKKPYMNIDHLREFLMLFVENANEISLIENEETDGIYVWEL